MQRMASLATLWLMVSASNGFAQHHGGGALDDGGRKDPATAVLLSIQPLPIDLGNFYTGNWRRGLVYTTAELVPFIPAAILLGRNGWSGRMHGYSGYSGPTTRTGWTTTERNQFAYLVAGYVAVKIISAFDAGNTAERRNRSLALRYDAKTHAAMLALNIPFGAQAAR